MRLMIDGGESGGGFSLVEHPMSPRARRSAAPSQSRRRVRILEIISPAGFEQYFVELVAPGGSRAAPPQSLKALGERYALEVNPGSIPELLERFHLRIGEPI